MLKCRLKLLGKILIALFLGLVIFLCLERFRGQITLVRYQQELRKKGEKLLPSDFAPAGDETVNGAPALFAAIARLTNGAVLPDSRPPIMKLMPSGRALVGFRENEWVESMVYRAGEWKNEVITNRWQPLAADLQKNADSLAEIREALTKSMWNNHVDFSQGAKLKILHVARSKTPAMWFGGASQLALHEGLNREALQNLLPQIRLPRVLAQDQVLISELVRIALGAIARNGTWEALQAEGWTDDDLLQIQQAWADQSFIPEMTRSFEGEVVLFDVWYGSMRASNDDCFEAMFLWNLVPADNYDWDAGEWATPTLTWSQQLRRAWQKQVHCRVWRFAWSHQAQRHGLEAIHKLVEIGRAATANKSHIHEQQAMAQWRSNFCGSGVYDRLRLLDRNLRFFERSFTRAMRAETDRSLTLSAIALKRHSRRHGKYPENLDALVPEYLPVMPVDYMDGKPIKYRRNGDGTFTLYSVGDDGQDDGGDFSLPEGISSRDLWRRRDYPWPAPATPEEVEEFRRDAGKN